jgi:peptidoglycan/LPS O-acetylase OafA/YrhL
VLNQLGRAVWGFSIGLVAFEYQSIYFRLAKSIKVIAISLIPVYLMIPYLGVFQSLISVWPFVAGIVILSQQVVSAHTSKICSFLGKYSYGFYLWHFPMLSLVGFIIRDLKSSDFSFSVFLLEINLTILLSTLATRISITLFEEPIRSRRK